MRTLPALPLTAVLGLGACFSWPAIPDQGKDPELRKLSDGKVLSLDLDLKDQPGLCPGKSGKLYAKGMVEWPGQKPVSRNIGKDVDSFPPDKFEVRGSLVTGDKEAHLHPSADILASVESGFEMSVTYTTEPDRFKWKKVIRPEYSCFSTYSVAGAEGGYGGDGDTPRQADVGQPGVDGGPGGQGGEGGNAGNITAWVTVVATAWHPKLYAVIADDGARSTFFLVPPERELWFVASGGPGGGGGYGGQGGEGGWQPWEEKEVPDENGNMENKKFGQCCPGNGGRGGDGANGGDGGDGGVINITYDSKFPELRQWIQTDVRPGAGGQRGGAGAGGNGGQSEADVGAQNGNPGGGGRDGSRDGRDGRAGRASVNAGNVSSRFNQRGIAIYGTPAAQSISTKANLPAISNLGGGARPTMGRDAAPPAPPPAPMPRRRR